VWRCSNIAFLAVKWRYVLSSGHFIVLVMCRLIDILNLAQIWLVP